MRPAARLRPGRRSTPPGAVLGLVALAAILAACSAADPRRSAGRPCRSRRPRRRRRSPGGSAAGRPARRRRTPRPSDRVVVLHRPPARRDGAPVRLRVRHLPRRAWRLPGHLGVAPGHHRRRPATASCTTSAAEIGPQVDRSARSSAGLRPGDRGSMPRPASGRGRDPLDDDRRGRQDRLTASLTARRGGRRRIGRRHRSRA